MALTQISTAGVKDDAVTAGKIPANAVGTSEIAADAVTGAQIADDAINSEHYTDGSIDTAHIADDAVTADKLANAINTDIAAKAVLTGSTNNTVATVTGANAIQGEANLTFDGSKLAVTGDVDVTDGAAVVTIKSTNAQTAGELHFDGDAVTSADYWLGNIGGRWNGNDVAAIRLEAGNDTTNKDDGLLTFHTSDASSAPDERMRIDNHGRVIKGHTSTVNTWGAGARSQVHGLIWEDSSRSQTRWANDTGSSTFMLCKSRSTTPGSFTAVQDDDNIGNIGWLGDDGTDLGESVARLDCYVDGTVASNQIPGRLVFSTTKANGQSSEKMTIRAGGEVDIQEKIRIGSFTSDYDQALVNLYSNSSTARIECSAANTTSTHINFRYTTTTHGSISHNQTSTSYNESSDYRLKENQTLISDGITRLKTLKPYRFNWKVTPGQTVDGFFAHELTAVPEAIFGTKDAMAPETFYEEGDTLPSGKKVGDVKTYSSSEIQPQQIDKSKLVPLLTAALQEAIAKIETLETKVAALEAG